MDISFSFSVSTSEDLDSIFLSDSLSNYGVKKSDSSEIVVPAGTPFNKLAPGQYGYSFTSFLGQMYDYVIRYSFKGIFYEKIKTNIKDLDSYMTLDEAEIYLATKTDTWSSLDTETKETYIQSATKIIDSLNYKDTALYTHAFPRGTQLAIPFNIKYACAEIALALSDDRDPEEDFRNVSFVSGAIASARTTYDRSFMLPHIALGIPSVFAWRLLLPFLADGRQITLSRV